MTTGKLVFLAQLLAHPRDLWLATRTVGWMTSLPLLKRVLPLPRLVRLMARAGNRRPREPERERHVADLVRRLCRVSGGNCLERSLILYRYLGRMNASPQLVVGFGKPDGYLGHVWVTVDGEPLLETADTLAAWAEATAFGAYGRRPA